MKCSKRPKSDYMVPACFPMDDYGSKECMIHVDGFFSRADLLDWKDDKRQRGYPTLPVPPQPVFNFESPWSRVIGSAIAVIVILVVLLIVFLVT